MKNILNSKRRTKKCPELIKVKKAAKDYPNQGIKKGEPYFWWKFRHGGKVFSKSYPKRSQLTQSSYLSTLYDIEDELGNVRIGVSCKDDLTSVVEDMVSRITDLKEECESSLDNMPESLQESSILNERIETLEAAIDELEGIDLDDCPDEDEEDEEDDSGESLDDRIEQWLDDKCDEISNVSLQ